MTGSIFLDTNILLYAEFNDGSDKYRAAKRFLLQDTVGAEVFVSAQVINEFYVQAERKGKTADEIETVIRQYIAKFNVLPLDAHLVTNAWRLKRQYQFSYWDSLIVAAALEASCAVLYTEDLQNGHVIEHTLTIVNPLLD